MDVRTGFAAVIAVLAIVTSVGCMTEFEPAPLQCDRVASPEGDDGASGTIDAPFATLRMLVQSLDAGAVGCAREGVYEGDLEIDRGAVVLRSMPGERATIRGQITIHSDDVVITDLTLDGTGTDTASVHILGDRVVLRGNDITNHRTPERCVVVGSYRIEAGDPASIDVVIDGNRIYDCGPIPAEDGVGGALVVYHARSAQVVDNLIYDNTVWGVLLFPDAQRTIVRGNVIDGNTRGVDFNSGYGRITRDTLVEHNLITNSEVWNVTGLDGMNNLVDRNCIFGGSRATSDNPGAVGNDEGWTLGSGNLFVDPEYVNRAADDFRPTEQRCAALLRP